jgi:iron complex outermembrane receptor protein
MGVLLVGTGSGVAYAQEGEAKQPVDDLDLVKLLNVEVSTATKTSESLADAPAVITVVTQEDIHRWGYRSVGEVLSHCVGFYVVDDHVMPNAGVRGMTGGLGAESGVIKVMIDGRSVAYRTTSGNWLGVELIPLESIKQIEIIRGPASALYGADAFLGVVNIITVPPDQSRPLRLRMFTGFTGSNYSEQVDAAIAGKSGSFDYLFGTAFESGSRSGLRMPSESPSPNLPAWVGDRRTSNNLDRKSLVLQGRLGYRVADVGHVIVSSYLSGFSRGGDFAPWAQLTNGYDTDGRAVGTVISQGQVRLNLDSLLHVSRQVDLALQSTYFEGGLLSPDRIELGSDLWFARRKTSYRGVDAMLESRYIPSNNFNLIVGVEGVLDHESMLAAERINRETGQPVPSTGSDDHRVNLKNIGMYASSNLRLIDPWLKLTGGIRYDNHIVYGSQLTGRVGATSRWSKAIVGKLLYGSAFKAPSPFLLYSSPLAPGDVQGNPRLRPQKIHTVEYQFIWKPNSFFGATTGVSYNWLFDKAEFTPQGINQVARNTASQRSLNWETRLDVKHYEDYSVYASLELVRSTRDLGQVGYAAQLVGTANIVYPPYIARAGATVAIPSPRMVPLMLGVEGTFVGPRRAANASIVNNGAPFELKSYGLVNAFVSTRDLYLVPGHESRVALRAYNILGNRRPDPGFAGFEYPLVAREVFLELQHTY